MTANSTRLLHRLLVLSPALAALLGAGCGPGGGGTTTLYDVLLRLSLTPETLGELSFRIGYQGGGNFVGSGEAVACDVVDDAGDAEADFDDDDVSAVTVDVTSEDGLEAGTDLILCTFSFDEQPTTGNFPITITNAADEAGNDVRNDQVAVVVTSITESGGGGSDEHEVTFRFTSQTTKDVAVIGFGASFTISGEFSVTGDEVDCETDLDGVDLEATFEGNVLEITIDSDEGFDTPVDLVTCLFIATNAPDEEDFEIEVIEAEDVEEKAIEDATVAVSSVTTR